ncbi:unnamed protein product [Lymnaea stagnalis]|uniref:Ion transport domain-containing protein n=1 Tax=Lymnaea stagnalis TaxID=6523 RepID=A0AAV2HMA9_LYMST
MSETDKIWTKSDGNDPEEIRVALDPELMSTTDADISNLSSPQEIDTNYELSEHHDEDTRDLTEPNTQIEEGNHRIILDEEVLLQAVVLIEDAYSYRTINHRLGANYLHVYRKYQSFPVVVFRITVILLLHLLAFIEDPSSLTKTSDLRTQGTRGSVPCWVTQCLELICLSLLLIDNFLRAYLTGYHYFVRQKWDMAAVAIITVSLLDWAVSFGMNCHEPLRCRRLLRPFFILQNSSLMKKIVRCLKRTLPEVISVLLLLALHIIVFTMFAMLLFPIYEVKESNVTHIASGNGSDIPATTPTVSGLFFGMRYFNSLLESFVSLLVLLTTANHPDVTLPAYSRNRFASIFFIIYLLIGLYFLMNMLLAVIYNQFRGYFLNSMQSSLLRRRLGVRAAFEVMRRKRYGAIGQNKNPFCDLGAGISGSVIKSLIERSLLPQHVRSSLLEKIKDGENQIFSASQFNYIFLSLDNDVVHKQLPAVRWFTHRKWRMIQRILVHKYFTYFGMLMAFTNLIIITIQLGAKYDSSFRENHSTLRIVNFTFVMYYMIEQAVKVWAFGWRRYLADLGNIYDAVITVALVIGETVSASLYGIPYFPSSKEMIAGSSSTTMWNILRLVNVLIIVRLFKAIPHIRSMSLIVMVLVDLLRNMKAFAGILVAIYYVFAIFGMQLFQGKIKYEPEFANKTFPCGTYEQMNYWPNNFDDFFSSIVVLWDVMVVNNWMVFLQVYRDKTSPWSYLYFVAWWLLSVIIVLNLFTALIMENFIMKWDRRRQMSETDSVGANTYEHLTISVHHSNVHSMFKDVLEEPTENELLSSLRAHRYLKLDSGPPCDTEFVPLLN